MKNSAGIKPCLKNLRIIAIGAFCGLQLFIYFFCVIFNQDLGTLPPHLAGYIAVAACFVFSLLFVRKSLLNVLLSAALFLTLAGDYFLVLDPRPQHYWAGVVFFIAVQILHMLNVFCGRAKKVNFASLFARLTVIVSVEIICAFLMKNEFGILPFLVIICFVSLLFNAAEACGSFKNNPLFAVGLILFVFCDIFVGLNFLFVALPFDTVGLIWLFYLPSQALFALYAACLPIHKQA